MDSRSFLAALQHADGFFPGGAASFSWGLEALRNDGLVATADDVTQFIAGKLRHRAGRAVTGRCWLRRMSCPGSSI